MGGDMWRRLQKGSRKQTFLFVVLQFHSDHTAAWYFLITAVGNLSLIATEQTPC